MDDARHIEIFKSDHVAPKWYFRVKADNGEIIAQSEGYYNRGDCYRTITTYFPEWRIEDLSGEGVTS
ncbi:MAG TPA: YegP family protein [Nitrospira sp.]|nr:YegP family protein [Nitrospira sp.]